MNICAPFIRRPIGTMLLATGLLLAGLTAYRFLPIASLPAIDLPTIMVTASRPGADPSTMAASVAAPLERQLGTIAGITEITSTSSLGTTRIIIQFDLSRNVDSAARDVQAAINAAGQDLPSDLAAAPSFRKFNPNSMPVLILALTSKTVPASSLYDAADTVLAQRIMQVPGVGDVSASGADQPAIRITLDPDRISAMGLSMDSVRKAIINANPISPLGSLEGPDTVMLPDLGGQLSAPAEFARIIVRSSGTTAVRLGDIARIERSVRNSRSMATYNGEPAVLLTITKEADGNVIETVDAIKALLPELENRIADDINIAVLTDRTITIRASVDEMQITLAIAIGLVMAVVLVFLHGAAPVLAAGVTVPLSLAATLALMWLAGFSINNLSLMALVISVGFVVDDAIVMVENIHSMQETGTPPREAALAGSRQVGFTIVSISLALLAVFLPLFFVGGIAGLFLFEFAATISFAVISSTLIALTVSPMILALRRQEAMPHPVRHAFIRRLIDRTLSSAAGFYTRTLRKVLAHSILTIATLPGMVGLIIVLLTVLPKSLAPQDDSGFIIGFTRAASDASFGAAAQWQRQAAEIIQRNPYVTGVGSSIGSSPFGGVNAGQFYVSLMPAADRPPATQVLADLRKSLQPVSGMTVFLFSPQEVRAGGRQSQSQYQFTLWSPDLDLLVFQAPKVMERLKKVPGLIDVNSDRQVSGLEARVTIDRNAAARLGVDIVDIDNALGNAFAQRQISTLYTQRNQYRVVLDIPARTSRVPEDIERLYVPSRDGTLVPMPALARIEHGLAPLSVAHQGQYPAITISYNLIPGTRQADVSGAILKAVEDMHLPAAIHSQFAGDASQTARFDGTMPLTFLAAILAIYIVLGVLYESLAHPLTILSTLPSATVGGLIWLYLADMEMTVVAFVGLILLVGIVMKNGIMLVDFALEAERNLGLHPDEAICQACDKRFRPIIMTTLTAILGAMPLILASGPGTELRRPLGVTIVGGLVVSQILTLYTTPVIYRMMARLHARLRAKAWSVFLKS